MDQYKGFIVNNVNYNTDIVDFTNGHILSAGKATDDIKEETIRRIQIRENIRAHLEKEVYMGKALKYYPSSLLIRWSNTVTITELMKMVIMLVYLKKNINS